MTSPALVCEVRCRGQKFSGWTSVWINRSYLEDNGSAATEFRLSVAEVSKAGEGWEGLKLRPEDEVDIFLAGIQVVRGKVAVRQVALNATSHAVQIQGVSMVGELTRASQVGGSGQFRGYDFQAIANKVCAPFGIAFKAANLPADALRPFKDVQVHAGESSFDFLERLARQRGIQLSDDEQGNLVGGTPGSASDRDEIVEGKNLWACSAVMQSDVLPQRLDIKGQQKGSDDVWGKGASQISASATNPAVTAYRPIILIAEEPAEKKDLQQRANREMAERIAKSVEVQATMQGWLRSNGALWRPGMFIKMTSPSVFPTKNGVQDLRVRGCTYAQTAEHGTTTTLDLCLETGLMGPLGSVPSGSSNILSPGATAAT